MIDRIDLKRESPWDKFTGSDVPSNAILVRCFLFQSEPLIRFLNRAFWILFWSQGIITFYLAYNPSAQQNLNYD